VAWANGYAVCPVNKTTFLEGGCFFARILLLNLNYQDGLIALFNQHC
jgi:hypothetical protein